MEAPSKAFLLFFLLPDWLKLNHLKSPMECGFSNIFSRHFCSTIAETIGLTNYAASFGAKTCSENQIEAAEMILGPWNQQDSYLCYNNWVNVELYDKFCLLFEQEIQIWRKLVVSNVATQCTNTEKMLKSLC